MREAYLAQGWASGEAGVKGEGAQWGGGLEPVSKTKMAIPAFRWGPPSLEKTRKDRRRD